MGNRFFDTSEDFGHEQPRRAYALIDQVEPDRLLLEGINADWYDRVMSTEIGSLAWLNLANEAPIFVLEVSIKTYDRWRPVVLPFTGEPLPRRGGPPRWIEIDFEMGAEEGLFYPNLFAQPRPIPIAGMRCTSEKLAVDLSRTFSLDDHISDERTIERTLDLGASIEWMGVYDVGQGSANGLCDSQGAPRGYFDLGGGVLANLSTFPGALSNFCTTYGPPVILSHWDWDHWSSGARFGPLAALTWVVPNQQLGAVHATFAANIVASGRLLVWPAGLSHVQTGQVRVEKCNARGRNQSGLAMLVAGPKGEPPILLTGDARYTVVPSGGRRFTSVVAPHHGADMRNRTTPVSPGLTASRAVYSYGSGNSFAHPRPGTYQDHHTNGWPHSAHQTGGTVDRHTAHRGPAGLGHIGLNWSGGQQLPVLPCAGACALGLVQT